MNLQYEEENGSRDKTIIRTSITGIIANVALAAFKAMIGMLSNSIAIVLDAVNNLSDALSSVITIVGTRLAGKEADRKKRRIKKLEETIESLENKIEDLKDRMSAPENASSYDKLSKLQAKVDEAEAELLDTMEKWEAEHEG